MISVKSCVLYYESNEWGASVQDGLVLYLVWSEGNNDHRKTLTH